MRTRAFLTTLAVGAVLLTAAPRLLAQSGAAAAAPAPAKFVSAASGSTIRVEGDSNIHKWHVESAKVEGTLVFNPADLDAGAWSVAPKVEAKVASATLVNSEEGEKMNKKVRETLLAEKFPAITYRLIEAGAPKVVEAGKKWTIPCRGSLTVAGKAVEFKFDLTVVKEGAGYTVSGKLPTAFTAFGLKPTTALMGMARCADPLVILINWKLAPAA